jgi:peptidoglycan/xylan/chitin deacetylase (PgdA/CDA1 family)
MVGALSARVFLGPVQLRLARQGVPVFAYHKIAPPPSKTLDPFLYVSPKEFDKQLQLLKREGFSSADLDEMPSAQSERKPRTVITFDDGCRNAFQNSMEPLARHGFRAIQFLVANYLGRTNDWDTAKGDSNEPLMDEQQVRDWLAAGHKIGSHTLNHPNLRHVSGAQARQEITDSKKSLEDRFGVAVRHFCYPYGSWNETVRDFVIGAGYSTACTMQFGVVKENMPRFELRRIIPLSSGELLRKCRHRLWRKLRTGK